VSPVAEGPTANAVSAPGWVAALLTRPGSPRGSAASCAADPQTRVGGRPRGCRRSRAHRQLLQSFLHLQTKGFHGDLLDAVGWIGRAISDLRCGEAVLGEGVAALGLGFGLLRHLNRQTAAVLGSLPAPQICLNYLGRFVAARSADWTAAPEVDALTPGCDPQMPRAYALEVNALTVDGAEGPHLTADWSWCPALLSEEEVRELADGWFASLESLVREAAQRRSAGLTPADVPLVSLTQSEIERLERKHGNIQDILPLSPFLTFERPLRHAQRSGPESPLGSQPFLSHQPI